MMEAFLVPDKTVVNAKGDGPALDVGQAEGRVFLLTLAITNIVEQESLDVAIYASADGAAWDAKPVAAFPQKFYCGTYQILLDLREHPEIRHVRAKYQAQRWGKGDPKPLFGAYLFAQEVQQQVLSMTA